MSIRASVSAREITPSKEVLLAGFTGNSRTSTGVRDPLYASAVHLRGGSGGVIVLSLDLLHIDPSTAQRIRRGIFDATGTREQNVFVTTTQNHSGPASSSLLYLSNDPAYAEPHQEYVDFVIQQAVLAASEAAVASCPSSAAIVTLDKPGTGALLIKSEKGRLLGMVLVYDRAPCTLGPANTTLSSDFLHVLRQILARKFGGAPVLAYVVAPSADRLLAAQPEYGESQAAKAAEDLANLIVSKVKALKGSDFMPNIEMGGRMDGMPELPHKNLPGLLDAVSAQAVAVTEEDRVTAINPDPARRRALRWTTLEASRTLGFVVAKQKGTISRVAAESPATKLQVLQLGKIRLCGIPGAVTSECALQLLPLLGNDVWLTECFDGDLQGSIISFEGKPRGSFRLLSGLYRPDAANVLINHFISFVSAKA